MYKYMHKKIDWSICICKEINLFSYAYAYALMQVCVDIFFTSYLTIRHDITYITLDKLMYYSTAV